MSKVVRGVGGKRFAARGLANLHAEHPLSPLTLRSGVAVPTVSLTSSGFYLLLYTMTAFKWFIGITIGLTIVATVIHIVEGRWGLAALSGLTILGLVAGLAFED